MFSGGNARAGCEVSPSRSRIVLSYSERVRRRSGDGPGSAPRHVAGGGSLPASPRSNEPSMTLTLQPTPKHAAIEKKEPQRGSMKSPSVMSEGASTWWLRQTDLALRGSSPTRPSSERSDPVIAALHEHRTAPTVHRLQGRRRREAGTISEQRGAPRLHSTDRKSRRSLEDRDQSGQAAAGTSNLVAACGREGRGVRLRHRGQRRRLDRRRAPSDARR